jgi:2-oxoglutarate dehydrogenase E2 component (dihydrolipoamide succinyltransferase)
MGKYLLKLPKMGESIAEATITKWLKEVGDIVEVDESIVEIATDKVDSDVPSEFKGKLIKKNFEVNDIVKVGDTIAEIETDSIDNDDEVIDNSPKKQEDILVENENVEEVESNIPELEIPSIKLLDDSKKIESENKISKSDRFYSPLVKSIAKKENISLKELDQISGSGKDGRVTKQDILNYIKGDIKSGITNDSYAPTQSSVGDQIVELDRMGKIIFNHMSDSKKISAHVQSFVEVDVSNVWDWREKYKRSFQENEGQKLTFTPIFISAVVKSLKDFPILNSSVVDDKIVIKRSINIGMATAVDNGNLIVPVIKKCRLSELKRTCSSR